MAKLSDFPEDGELVVGTVAQVQKFGAFVNLDEYEGKQGFCHIREVAPGWVKRIRDFIREQQRLVFKVQGVDSKKGHIDLSLKAVNDHQKRETIQRWKNEQKADKFLEILAEREKTTVEALMDTFGRTLIETWGELYTAFQEAAEYGEELFKEEGIEGDWIPMVVEFAKENIQVQYVEITGFLDLQTTSPTGVKEVAKALKAAEKSEFDDVRIDASYLGSPTYRIKVQAPDYKIAEEQLRKASDRAVTIIKKAGGSGQYRREMEERA